MDKTNITRLVSMAGMCLAGIATLIGNWAQDRHMKEEIKKTVDEALAEKDI